MVIAFCVLRNLCLRQFLWQQLMQGWKIVMHYVAWTSKHYSQDSKGDPKKPIDETWDVCSCHICGEKSEDLVYFAFSKYSEVQYIVWEREIQIWWNGKVHFEQEMKSWRWVKRGNKKRLQYPRYPPEPIWLLPLLLRLLPKIKSTNPGISIGDVDKKLVTYYGMQN